MSLVSTTRHCMLMPMPCAVAPVDARWLLPKPRLTGPKRSRPRATAQARRCCAHYVYGAASGREDQCAAVKVAERCAASSRTGSRAPPSTRLPHRSQASHRAVGRVGEQHRCPSANHCSDVVPCHDLPM